MKLYSSILFLSLFLFNSCSSTLENVATAFEAAQLDIVTGVKFYDINGEAIGQAGNPNTKKSDVLAIYPNPNDGNITVQCSNNEGFTVWITRAEKYLEFSDFDYVNLNFNYEDELLETNKVLKGNTDLNILAFDISLLGKGYYRLVAKDNIGNTLIENLYFDPAMTPNEMIAFLFEEFSE